MHLYSHLVIAHELLPDVQPADLPEYYWGAIAPDVRYLAGLPRRRTHPPLDVVRTWPGRYPELRSFVLGYWVHVLADERDAAGFVYDGIPLRALRQVLPRSLAAVWLEAAYAEQVRLQVCVSGSFNPILADMGIPPEAAASYARAANRYAAAPSLEMAFEMLVELGLSGSPRLQRYLRIARLVQASPLLRRMLLGRIDTARITRRITTDLRAHLEIT